METLTIGKIVFAIVFFLFILQDLGEVWLFLKEEKLSAIAVYLFFGVPVGLLAALAITTFVSFFVTSIIIITKEAIVFLFF